MRGYSRVTDFFSEASAPRIHRKPHPVPRPRPETGTLHGKVLGTLGAPSLAKQHLTPEKRKNLEIELLEAKKKKIDLAKKYGITRQQVNNIERKLRKVSAPLVAKQKAESLRQMDKVVTDTVAERQRLRGELLDLIKKLDPMGAIAIPTKTTIIEKIGRLLDSEDRAVAMGKAIMGPMDDEELRARDEAFYDQVKAKVSPAAQVELEKAVAEILAGSPP